MKEFCDKVRFAAEGAVEVVGRSRPVIAVEVDETTLDQWCSPQNGCRPRNGLLATAVTPFEQFASGYLASVRLGLKNNEVALHLGKAAREGRDRATLRGVTFQYVDVFSAGVKD